MKPLTSPTSPKYRLEQQAEGKPNWPAEPFVRPAAVPWGRLLIVMIVVGILSSAGTIAGLHWIGQRWPQLPLGQWLNSRDTTIIRQVERPSTDVPDAVRQVAGSLYGLAPARPTGAVYSSDAPVGTAVLLSSNGWAVTLSEVVGDATANAVALPTIGDPVTVDERLADPATPFTFVRLAAVNGSPADLAAAQKELPQTVWVITPRVHDLMIARRQLIARLAPTWRPSDRAEVYYQLDSPAPNSAGAVAVNAAGQVIGLLDRQQRLWPTASLDHAVAMVIQQDRLARPRVGLHYLDRRQSIVPGQPTAEGWLIAAAPNEQAVEPKGPADKAGLKAGDLILTVDRQPPANKDFFTLIQAFAPGDRLGLTYQRDGVERETTITVAALEL